MGVGRGMTRGNKSRVYGGRKGHDPGQNESANCLRICLAKGVGLGRWGLYGQGDAGSRIKYSLPHGS